MSCGEVAVSGKLIATAEKTCRERKRKQRSRGLSEPCAFMVANLYFVAMTWRREFARKRERERVEKKSTGFLRRPRNKFYFVAKFVPSLHLLLPLSRHAPGAEC